LGLNGKACSEMTFDRRVADDLFQGFQSSTAQMFDARCCEREVGAIPDVAWIGRRYPRPPSQCTPIDKSVSTRCGDRRE
jgi:hypothetical protein